MKKNFILVTAFSLISFAACSQKNTPKIIKKTDAKEEDEKDEKE